MMSFTPYIVHILIYVLYPLLLFYTSSGLVRVMTPQVALWCPPSLSTVDNVFKVVSMLLLLF